jgi:hypothetical protein
VSWVSFYLLLLPCLYIPGHGMLFISFPHDVS